jgi:hypothetical protein
LLTKTKSREHSKPFGYILPVPRNSITFVSCSYCAT